MALHVVFIGGAETSERWREEVRIGVTTSQQTHAGNSEVGFSECWEEEELDEAQPTHEYQDPDAYCAES